MHPPISQNIVFTYTDDLERAARFFGEVMELERVVDQGACLIYRLSAQAYLGVCDLPGRPREPTGVTITIVSDDVDGWYEFLQARGVEFARSPAHSARFGVTSALFVSPHGYRIEIQRFDDPAWHGG